MTAAHVIEEVREGRLVQLAPRAYYVESTPNGAANAGIVVGDDATLLVDTRLTPALGADLAATARRLTGDDDRQLYFVNTHFHGDHVFGNAELVAAGAVGIASEHTRAALSSEEVWADQVDFFVGIRPHQSEEFRSARRTAPAIGVADTGTIDLGGVTVSLRTLPPAHTNGGELIAVVDGQQVVYTADVIFNGYWPVLWQGDLGGWLTSLRLLRELEGHTIVPGHGPAGGAELIDQMEACWELLASLAASDAEGAPALEAAARASAFADWSYPARVVAAVRDLRGGPDAGRPLR